ncbi:uncharacterized protein LOC124530814 [Vanessa cardui]|uniref:uncharacterized protein LOC124530814 n=1 Tax=Vanessa cardui TaxID=171605 RepID=UPI001F13974A|nr:uncharacterized protein LOC124530814 [Vanessa cardui]
MKMRVIILFLIVYYVTSVISEKTSKQRILYLDTIKEDNSMDVTDFSVYYDIQTNKTIKRMMPRPWYKPGWLLRLPFRGGPCECDGLQCKCCTGVRIQAFNFDRRTCATLTYEPMDSTLDLDVMMNNASVFRDSFSTRNPPPFCIPIPVPYLPPGLVDMCVRLFDISIVEQRLHVCMDMDTRIDKAPVVILHFDCMDMGARGVGLSKPGGSGTQPNTSEDSSNLTTQEPIQIDSDVYDVVTESVETTEKSTFKSIKYI